MAVKTASGAMAVQIVWSSRRGARSIEHIGSARGEAELAALKAAAAERVAAGQEVLDLDVDSAPAAGPLPITSSRMGALWDALCTAYRCTGLDAATDGDEVFRDLVLGRIIEPTSKLDTIRVLGEVGIKAPSYATIKRRLPGYAKSQWRQRLSKACADRAALGPASLVLYDVSTLYFETDKADGFREPGFSKERRLEPQITIGLLADASGAPLSLQAFEGDKPETHTMVPVITAFRQAHQLRDVTVVADAGMISEANQIAIAAAGLTFILGARIPRMPSIISVWSDAHPDQGFEDQQIFTQPWAASSFEKARGVPDVVIHYQYRAGRARRSLRGIDEQIAKAEKSVAGKASVKRNRFITLEDATKSVNRSLEAKARALAGWKGYSTNLTEQSPQLIISAYHQLWRIEKGFRMSKHDLAARPIYHHLRESIEAHLNVVFAALAVSHWIKHQTGWSIKRFVQTARRYRTITIAVGDQTITAADPLPPDLRDALRTLQPGGAH